MNRMRRDGKQHASEAELPRLPDQSRHRLLCADVHAGLASLPDASVDLILCDPPYNLELAGWDQFDRYLDWATAWLTECIRILTENGSFVIFGGLQYQGAKGGDLLELMHYLRTTGDLRLVNLIIWNYANGMSAHRFFANRHEEIVWYAKGSKYVFNLDAVREPFDPETRARYLKDKRLRPESVAKGKNPTNVWRIGRLNGNSKERTGHPTQKPRALIERLILALTHPGQTVLDPFAGSAVTARVGIEHRRHTVSIDVNPNLRQQLEQQLKDFSADRNDFVIEE